MSGNASLKWLTNHTSLPVPEVIMVNPVDDPTQNALGVEWMLQSFMSGRVLGEAWNELK